MNILRLQDNPIVAKLCLLLLSLAAINYLFVAFGKNPLVAVMPHKTVQMVVFISIGLCGIQLFFRSFDVKQIVPGIRGIAQSAVGLGKKGLSAAQKEIETLENFRHRNRYQCGCGM